MGEAERGDDPVKDDQIIALFFARSQQALTELDRKYGAVCGSVARNILRNPQDAEECVNDAYLGVWNTIPPQHPDPLLTYLCRIVRNRSIKRYHANTAQKRNSSYDVALDELTQCIPATETVESTLSAQELTQLNGEVEFRDVGFAYKDDGTEVLSHINLHVTPGESVALVGPSGGGKTTMCSLIPRFYDVTEGAVLLDGKDVRSLTLHSLRSLVGVVQQDVYLFSGSVFENIQYGRPGASREEVMEAAKKAGAHEFIMHLSDDYDTYVGERGVKLSGGQKQRISIARAFLKNPPVLILDEATSALDNESEKLVQESLEKLSKGRTTFTIAHRLSTIRRADTILVLTEKGIEERGNHQELLEKGGIYAHLYELSTGLEKV